MGGVEYQRKVSQALCCTLLVDAESFLFGMFSEVSGIASKAALRICSVTYHVASSGDKLASSKESSVAFSLKRTQSAFSNLPRKAFKNGGNCDVAF